jgi:hypothetical protein
MDAGIKAGVLEWVCGTSAAGYHIDSVFLDGIHIGTVSSYQFNNLPASHTLSAKFSINISLISAVQGNNGTISPASATVNHGDSSVFTIVPNVGYVINSIAIVWSNTRYAVTLH